LGENLVTEDLDEILAEAYEHLKQGRYRMALTAAKKVYDQKPDDFKVIMCLAWATLENGDPVYALELANNAVQISGDNVNARLYRGFLLMRMGVFDGAISDLDNAILREPDLLSWAHLNKARALAGLGRFFEALEEIEKAIQIDSAENSKLLQVRDWIKRALGYDEGIFGGFFTKKKPLLEEVEDALRQKEYWFSLWAAKEILGSPSQKKYHNSAHLIELESLIGIFQFRPAMDKANDVKEFLDEEDRFQSAYQRILKYFPEDEKINKFEEPIQSAGGRSDLTFHKNKFFKVHHARTYNLIDNIRSGRRTYLLQFTEESLTYVGVEVVFDNPFYNQKDEVIDGVAVWYLNNNEVGKHNFNIPMQKTWNTVEFVQSWGTDTPGFWSRGQGRVDIYLDNNIICSRWFLIGYSEVVNFEETEIDESIINNYEKPNTNQPKQVSQSSLQKHEDESLEDLLNNLNTYIGLDSVKQSMQDFVAYLRFIKEREKIGLKTDDIVSVNSIFLGNPGTGKTTVARLLGKIFKAMGILENGHVIEVDRTGLVGQYIGETAQKTEKVINEAIGGILFIDEAYTLKKAGNQQDFGQEAIDILLKRMEDRKGDFVVICAGYPEEMKNFINSNPGLKSRFTHFFNFDDYTPIELIEIFKSIAKKEEYIITSEAISLMSKVLTNLYRKRDSSFGNARLVRNYFNEVKMQLSKRYLKTPAKERNKESMTTIGEEDVNAVIGKVSTKEVKLGVDEESLEKALKKLNNLVGLKIIKDEIDQIIKLARLYIDQKENLQDKFANHFVFLGSPGTGKTTVARIFSEIYSALGILPKGHLIETDRQGLVAGYVGQTTEKTRNVIDKASGGTLLIDEAYTLIKKDNSSDFGQEAIDTLLKRMEDDRGKFIVIATGYTNEMRNFLDSNPGMKSRFTKEIIFEDYTPDELLEITERYLIQKGHSINDDVKEVLNKYYNKKYNKRNKSFGNARMIKNMADSFMKNHLLRIADLPVEERTEEVLKKISLEDVEALIRIDKDKSKTTTEGNNNLLDEYMKELSELTGLESVKKSVEKLVSSLKVSKLRKERGLKVIPKNLHSIFTGNPGTGKTTVARLLSKIFKEMGILEKGHLIEVDRTALIAAYSGQTSAKTEKVIDSALGGILFIDDAYSLIRGGNTLGHEAIDTLLKRMEDYAGKFVIIVSGYVEEMRDFVNSNPGLESRFTNFFSFNDYTPRQMLEITLVISTKSGYNLDEGAWQLLLEIFTNLYEQRDKNFGNARTVRNILYKAISNQEERILTIANPSDEDLTTITLEDVDKINYSEIY